MSVFFTFLFPAFTEVTSAKKDMENDTFAAAATGRDADVVYSGISVER